MDEITQAIADPIRREIIEMLSVQPLAAGEIADAFTVSRPAISRHLRVLREAGLVRDRNEGRRRVYALDPEALRPIAEWIATLDRTSVWESRLFALDTEVERARRTRDTTQEQSA